jgi:hypothetical protein
MIDFSSGRPFGPIELSACEVAVLAMCNSCGDPSHSRDEPPASAGSSNKAIPSARDASGLDTRGCVPNVHVAYTSRTPPLHSGEVR